MRHKDLFLVAGLCFLSGLVGIFAGARLAKTGLYAETKEERKVEPAKVKERELQRPKPLPDVKTWVESATDFIAGNPVSTADPASGKILKWDGDSLSWAADPLSNDYWTLSGSDLYPNDGAWEVGIGTTSPGYKLHVATDLMPSAVMISNTGGDSSVALSVRGGGTSIFVPTNFHVGACGYGECGFAGFGETDGFGLFGYGDGISDITYPSSGAGIDAVGEQIGAFLYSNNTSKYGFWCWGNALHCKYNTDNVLIPYTDNCGYVGTYAHTHYYHYSVHFVTNSLNKDKRAIHELDDATYELAMADIDRVKPSFFKHKLETDEMEPGNEAKCRPQMELGIMVEDAPDYIQDNTFSAICDYSLATLAIVGVKYLRKEIQELRKELGLPEKKIDEQKLLTSISSDLMSQLRVPEWKKEQMREWAKRQVADPSELTISAKPRTIRKVEPEKLEK